MDITTIVPIRAFQDNYIWCLRRGSTAVVVDPGDAGPVLDYLSNEGLRLAAILATHHHSDHVGGNIALLSKYNVPVFGPAQEKIPGITRPLREGDTIEVPGVGLHLRYSISLATPRDISPTTVRACCSAVTPCFPAGAADCSRGSRANALVAFELAALPATPSCTAA